MGEVFNKSRERKGGLAGKRTAGWAGGWAVFDGSRGGGRLGRALGPTVKGLGAGLEGVLNPLILKEF